MRTVVMYLSTNQREQLMGKALVEGFRKHGVNVRAKLRSDFWSDHLDADSDIVVFVGVKSRKMWNACHEKGKKTLLIDKSYFGRGDYYRMSLGGYQPPYLLRMHQTTERMRSMGVNLQPRRQGGTSVLFAGSSNKYHLFHQLEPVGDYAVRICGELRQQVNGRMPIVYRPKPSWWVNDDGIGKVIPEGCVFSRPNELFIRLLPQCHCLVTHGSNAAVEALAAGVPVIVLSKDSPVYTLAEHDIANVENPHWPTDAEREHVLANLAWCQFSLKEIASGMAWASLSQWI